MNSRVQAQRADTQGIIWTLSRRILMVVALTLAFFLSALLTIFIMFRGGDTRVPDVIGKTEVEAKSLMEASKFEIKIQRRADDTPMNTVIETRPAPNSSVKTNSVVTLVVSSGPAQNKSQILPAAGAAQVASRRPVGGPASLRLARPARPGEE